MEIRIVDIIKELCRENRTSIPRLEKEVGLSNGSIYNWNKSYPSIDKVVKVADYFGVTIDELIGRSKIHKQSDKDDLAMVSRKVDGELTLEETILLKKLANLLINKDMDI